MCLQGIDGEKDSYSGVSHLLVLYCEGATHVAGDLCTSIDDCRPASADFNEGLKCDAETSKCVLTSRLEAPSGFGGNCGLLVNDVSVNADEDKVVQGKKCDDCHVILDESSNCLKQACTIECQFDEDCPEGSVCSCVSSNSSSLFCILGTNRSTAAGRTTGLKCY